MYNAFHAPLITNVTTLDANLDDVFTVSRHYVKEDHTAFKLVAPVHIESNQEATDEQERNETCESFMYHGFCRRNPNGFYSHGVDLILELEVSNSPLESTQSSLR